MKKTNINDLSTQLLYTTIPIYSTNQNNTLSMGTGFIFSIKVSESSSIPLLITNYHVLEDANAGFFELHLAENGMPVSDKSIRVQFDKTIISNNKLGNLDLIAVPLGASLTELKKKNVDVFFRSVDQNMIPSDQQNNDFAAIEDVTFIGYPNALYDNKNKIPIVRQGITATPIWNDFNGKEEFLIDAGVFPGSSGSPVFIYNQGTYPTTDGIAVGSRLLFIGVIYSSYLSNSHSSNEDDANKSQDYLNLGKVIKSQAMFRELETFTKKFI